MSLEEQLHSLQITIEKLHDIILERTIEFMPDEDMRSSAEAALDREIEEHIPGPLPHHTNAGVMHGEPEPSVQGADTREIDLIALSKEMGFQYLQHNGTLTVDNRVLDEYNRRSLGGADEVSS